ncbi:hypothetical protein OEG84_17185 [Hoeflea sp. G2-23]|uniref:Histidine kinase n=1 Tax=Hoeflea algicola TaxID=2983763 RepID=A0ABT3ZC65_9HYPH|nr:hypothetical protein [Hoeflea algicola]MCY0149397.1 hypothetical protein [Hoeflea algicola]
MMRGRLSRYLGHRRVGRILAAGEFTVLVLAIWSITYLLTGNGFGFDLAPHPMWIPVLLFSIQHGSSGGLLAAVAVSTMFIFGTGFRVGTIGLEPTELATLFARPVAWIITALVLGSIVDRRQTMNSALRRRIKMNHQRQRRLTAIARTLKERNLLLQRAVTLGHTGVTETMTTPVLSQPNTVAIQTQRMSNLVLLPRPGSPRTTHFSSGQNRRQQRWQLLQRRS